MRWRIGTVLSAAAVTVLAACSVPVAGTPRQAPYEPIPAGSMTASMADPVPGAVAYSEDGQQVAVIDDAQVCVRPAADPGTGGACPTLPDDAIPSQISFGPSGRTLAVLEDYQRTYQGRLWLVDTGDGSVRQVPFPTQQCGKPAPGTLSAPVGEPTAPSTPTTTEPGESQEPPGMYLYTGWLPDGRLAAAAHPSGDRQGDCIVLIEPSTGGDLDPVPVPDAVPPGAYVWGYPEVGGSTLAYPIRRPGDSELRIGVLDVRDGSHRTVTMPEAYARSQLHLMAVSPDGSRVIIGGIDPLTYRETPVSVLGLRDDSTTTLVQEQDGYTVDAVFSPDGSQVLMAVQGVKDEPARLSIVPADGGPQRTIAELDADLPILLDLAWTRGNRIVPTSPRAADPLDTVASWQLSG